MTKSKIPSIRPCKFSVLMAHTKAAVISLLYGFRHRVTGQACSIFHSLTDARVSYIRRLHESSSFILPIHNWSNKQLTYIGSYGLEGNNMGTDHRLKVCKELHQKGVHPISNNSLFESSQQIVGLHKKILPAPMLRKFLEPLMENLHRMATWPAMPGFEYRNWKWSTFSEKGTLINSGIEGVSQCLTFPSTAEQWKSLDEKNKMCHDHA